jgi:two-component sensor histidine kinase
MFNTIPQSKYTDFYDIARFNLTWNINAFLAFSLPLLAVVLFNLGEMSAVPTFIGFLINIISLIILKTTKSYFVPALIFGLLGTILCQYTLLFYDNSYHFVDVIWIIIIVLYVFFTLGKLWGGTILTINILGAVYYILFHLKGNFKNIKSLENGDVYALSINFAISGMIIYYLLNQFFKTTKHAENKYLALTKELEDKNFEKTIMLKEIHHRVKNNLQVITSLLRLQSREIKDEKSLSVYEDSIDRVIAMSLIHEKMYQAENLSKIDLKGYITSLAKDLLESYAIHGKVNVTVKSNVDVISLKPLVPIALIFNELISNALKHAFSEGVGEIYIDIKETDKNLNILFKDNGTWKENDTCDSSFGTELIKSLTEQLNGVFKKSVVNGTEYNFTLYPNK